MWSLALRERGVPGRKIVLWLGYGGPNHAVEPVFGGRVRTANALASKAGEWRLTTKVTDPKAPVKTTVALELHLPAKTKRVRFVVRDLANGRMGTTEISMKAVQGAPETEEQNRPLPNRPTGR